MDGQRGSEWRDSGDENTNRYIDLEQQHSTRGINTNTLLELLLEKFSHWSNKFWGDREFVHHFCISSVEGWNQTRFKEKLVWVVLSMTVQKVDWLYSRISATVQQILIVVFFKANFYFKSLNPKKTVHYNMQSAASISMLTKTFQFKRSCFALTVLLFSDFLNTN